MAWRRRVSFPTMSNGVREVSFFAKARGIAVPKRKNKLKEAALDLLGIPKRKKITFTARGSGTEKRQVSFYAPSLKLLRKRARLKREVVNEVSAKIEEEFYEGEEWEEEYPEIRDIILRAARLAIELWEKRR